MNLIPYLRSIRPLILILLLSPLLLFAQMSDSLERQIVPGLSFVFPDSVPELSNMFGDLDAYFSYHDSFYYTVMFVEFDEELNPDSVEAIDGYDANILGLVKAQFGEIDSVSSWSKDDISAFEYSFGSLPPPDSIPLINRGIMLYINNRYLAVIQFTNWTSIDPQLEGYRKRFFSGMRI